MATWSVYSTCVFSSPKSKPPVQAGRGKGPQDGPGSPLEVTVQDHSNVTSKSWVAKETLVCSETVKSIQPDTFRAKKCFAFYKSFFNAFLNVHLSFSSSATELRLALKAFVFNDIIFIFFHFHSSYL